MNKNNLNSKRRKILSKSKIYIVQNGWNENLFRLISKNNKININEILTLFPEGYKSLLKFYLKELDIDMTSSVKKLGLTRMKTHQKIREIILLRLKIKQNEKDLIKRTYFSLFLPKHLNILLKSLYNVVDQIWFIAGDNSTNFNFYSKRAILATIYSSTVLYWINNKNFEETTKFLDKQLKKISKIPKIKKKLKMHQVLLS